MNPVNDKPGQRSGHGAGSLVAHMEADAARKAAGRTAIVRAAYSVLVVDDNAATRYSLARSLGMAGYVTLEAATGMEALRLVESASAIVLDLHLPDIDGMEICRLVRGNGANAQIPIVHVSALHKAAEDVRESSKAGANAFLAAPVNPDELLQVIDSLLARRAGADAGVQSQPDPMP